MIEIPERLGDCIDKLYALRAERLSAQKAIDVLKAQEAMLNAHILEEFSKTELSGAKGDVASCSIKQTTVYNITDWDALTQFAHDTGSYDLLTKKVSSPAVKARYENGQEVPGVEPYVKTDLSLTKVKR